MTTKSVNCVLQAYTGHDFWDGSQRWAAGETEGLKIPTSRIV